jgi:hypothetical protein
MCTDKSLTKYCLWIHDKEQYKEGTGMTVAEDDTVIDAPERAAANDCSEIVSI